LAPHQAIAIKQFSCLPRNPNEWERNVGQKENKKCVISDKATVRPVRRMSNNRMCLAGFFTLGGGDLSKVLTLVQPPIGYIKSALTQIDMHAFLFTKHLSGNPLFRTSPLTDL